MEGAALAPGASFRGPLQGQRDETGIDLGEDAGLEVEGAAGFGHTLRPAIFVVFFNGHAIMMRGDAIIAVYRLHLRVKHTELNNML